MRMAFLLPEGSNVGIIHGVPSGREEKVCNRLTTLFKDEIVAMPTVLEEVHLVSDNEEYDPEPGQTTEHPKNDPGEQPSSINETHVIPYEEQEIQAGA
jgi:hypothetical protein